jgi:hypothetical protein
MAVPNIAFTANLEPQTEYTVAEIAELTDIPAPTVYARMKRLTNARYFKEKGIRRGEGRGAKTYILDIAAGHSAAPSWADHPTIAKQLVDNRNFTNSARVFADSWDSLAFTSIDWVYGYTRLILRYFTKIKSNPSTSNVDSARAEFLEDLQFRIDKLNTVVRFYVHLRDSLEMNDPIRTGLYDWLDETMRIYAEKGTTFEDELAEVEEAFKNKAN